jgi:hypothetical protein
MPREGTELVGHYATGLLGRPCIVDALPGNEGKGLMIVCTSSKPGADGATEEQVDGVFPFFPTQVAETFNQVTGTQVPSEFWGVILDPYCKFGLDFYGVIVNPILFSFYGVIL